jgi:hypothetical protein
MKRYLLVFVFSLVGAVSAAFAQSVPVAEPADPNSFIRGIDQASSGWKTESAAIRGLLRKLKALADRLERLEQDVAKGRRSLRDLIAEKERALDEMRRGQFCSGCGQTKSAILAQGETFPHSGQREIPASPEQLKKAEEDFDRRIVASRAALRKNEQDEAAVRDELNATYFDFNRRRPIYHAHFAQEQNLRMQSWDVEKAQWEAKLADLGKLTRDAEKALKAEQGSAEGPRLEEERSDATSALAAAREQVAAAREQEVAVRQQLATVDQADASGLDDAARRARADLLSRVREALQRATADVAAAEETVAAQQAALRTVEEAQTRRKARLELLQINHRVLQRQREDTMASARSAQRRAEQQAEQYVKSAFGNLEQTGAAAKGIPAKFGLAGEWFIRETLQKLNPPIRCFIESLRGVEPENSASGLRDRLELTAPGSGTNQPAPEPRRSMRDLLESR